MQFDFLEDIKEKGIVEVDYTDEMKSSYIDYAMSVITSRALPDIRDGLKPVQRRILYSMGELGLSPNKSQTKSAKIVGHVLGAYHPHGDSSVYEAMVRLAQDFNVRYPLVHGGGNFGSIDGDGAAAYRYTSAKLTKMGYAMLKDIDKNTVPFKPNFDESTKEPEVLPTLIPYSLLSGISGIAVGMATNMAPYNVESVYNALIYILEEFVNGKKPNDDIILENIGMPDFPTGGVIVNYTEAKKAVKEGKGRVIIRAKYDIVNKKNGTDIVITEIPYQVNKTNLIKKINEQKEELTAIREVRDESTSDIRIVIELKKNAQINLVLNTLFKNTQLQSTFSINNTVLIDNKPFRVGMTTLLVKFIEHSTKVMLSKHKYEMDLLEKDKHIRLGTLIALKNVNDIIEIIKSCPSRKDAEKTLMEKYNLSEVQAKTITSTQLGTLTNGSIEEVEKEIEKMEDRIKYIKKVTVSPRLMAGLIIEEYKKLREELKDDRRTTVDYNADPDIDIDDLIEDETLIITYTTEHLIKSIPEKEFKSQNRGGKGSKGVNLSDEDIVESLYTLNSKDDLLFITDKGQCYKLKAYDIEKSNRNTRGRFIGNYLDLEEDEKVLRMIALNLEERKDDYLIMVTKNGMIKKIQISDLGVRNARVITFKEGDYLVDCYPIDEDKENVMITTNNGMSILIDSKTIRSTGRAAIGVIGITLNEGDYVNSTLILNENSSILTISENGLGKMTSVDEFNIQNRGGKGVIYYKTTKKTGKIVDSIAINEGDEILVMTEKGISIRLKTKDLPIIGRSTSGSKMIDLKEGDKVNSITSIIPESEEELEEEED